MSQKASVSPFRKHLLEAVTIVLSILLAFAVDAWWDNRVEINTVNESLAAVLVDFENALHEFERSGNLHRDRIQAIQVLTSTERTELLSLSPDSLNTLMWHSTFPTTADPQMATLEGMIASGQLSRIKSPELRSRLAEWDGMFRDFDETQGLVLQEVMHRVNPAIGAHVIVTRGFSNTGDFDQDYRGALESSALLHSLFLVLGMSQGALLEMGRLIELTEIIISEIRDEIGMAA